MLIQAAAILRLVAFAWLSDQNQFDSDCLPKQPQGPVPSLGDRALPPPPPAKQPESKMAAVQVSHLAMAFQRFLPPVLDDAEKSTGTATCCIPLPIAAALLV